MFLLVGLEGIVAILEDGKGVDGVGWCFRRRRHFLDSKEETLSSTAVQQ